MELTQLKQFKAIAETQNISEAANILYVTQPALSNSLNRLEKELGVQLFDRAGKKITLNEQGQIVLKTVESILSQLDDMILKLHDMGFGKNIKFCTAIVIFIYYILPIFSVGNPDLRVFPQIVVQEEIPTLLKKNAFDCAIISYTLDSDEFYNMEICTDYAGIGINADDPLSQKKEIALKDLANRSFSTFLNQNPLSNMAKEYLEKVPGIKYIYNRDLTSNQLYISKTNELSIYASTAEFIMGLDDNRVFVPFEKKEGIKMTYYFVYKKTNPKSTELNKMAMWIKDYFEEYNRTSRE